MERFNYFDLVYYPFEWYFCPAASNKKLNQYENFQSYSKKQMSQQWGNDN